MPNIRSGAADRTPGQKTRPRRARERQTQNLVPYTGAVKDIDLGAFAFTTTGAGTFGSVVVSGQGSFGTVVVTGLGTFGTATVTGLGTFGSILVNTNGKVNWRDAAIGMYSQADTFLDIFADGGVRIGDSSGGAPTNYTLIGPSGDITPVGSADIVIEKASGNGIKVDKSAKTFGFRDILGDQFTKNTGGTRPTLAVYNGVIQAWKFAAGDEAYMSFHIPHDHVTGTDIFLHIHWSHISTIVTGGTITFKATSIYAKAHDQAAFQSSPAVGTFTGTASTTQYQQILSEIQYSASTPTGLQLDTDDLEPDGVIELTLEVDANDMTADGTVPDPFIHYIDVHYQSTNIATKDKAPDFYA